MKNFIQTKLAILFGRYFSLDRKFRKDKAIATIFFLEDLEYGGSIKIEMNGVHYFFEGTPIIEKYKNAEGKEVVKTTREYGGWEMDMAHPNNKLW